MNVDTLLLVLKSQVVTAPGRGCVRESDRGQLPLPCGSEGVEKAG